MKRYPTDTPTLRTACCGLCPLALPRGPRTPFSGRQVARVVHDELPPERERRFHLPAVAFPLGPRPGRKTWPYPVRSQKRGGLGGGEKEGGLVRNRGVFKRPEKFTESRRGPGPGPPAALRSLGSAQLAAPASGASGDKPGPSAAWAPRRPTVTPAAPRRGRLRGFLRVLSLTTVYWGGESCPDQPRGATGAQGCSNRSGQPPSSGLRQVPALPLQLFASTLRARTCSARFQGLPTGNTQLAPGSQGHLGAPCRGGESCPGAGEVEAPFPPRLSAEMGPEGASPLLESLSFSLWRQAEGCTRRWGLIRYRSPGSWEPGKKAVIKPQNSPQRAFHM